MWIVLAIIAIILILLLIALMSSITFTLWVRKHNKDDKAVLDIKMLYGLIKLHYEMPKIVFEDMKRGFLIRLEKKSSIKQNKAFSGNTHINKRKVDHWANDVRIILRSTASFKKWLHKTLMHFKVLKLEWSTNISTGDAAWTAMLTGSVWGIKATLVGWLSFKVRMKQRPKLFVVPVFQDEPEFATELSCIAKISCGYAIYAGMILTIRIVKVNGGLGRWMRLLKQGKRKKAY